MDNGAEVIAKLPYPCAGPSFLATASEVATREFLRGVLDIPTPRVIAWSGVRHNLVGAEYILEEKAPGKPLGKLWRDWIEWPMKDRFTIIQQIVEMERKLASVKFVKSGCVYFRKDVPDSTPLVTDPPLPSSISERFTLGPLVERGMWQGEKGRMGINRGPFRTSHEFVEAMAKNEIHFIKANARPRMNYARSLTDPELPDEMLELLTRYLQLAPAMVPRQSTEDTHSPTLWHPDLHLDNVFVDPQSKKIAHIIDWQSSAVLPFFYQCGVPPMFRHRGPISDDISIFSQRPENYNTLDRDEKGKIDDLLGSEYLHKYYLGITRNRNPRHAAALQLHNEVRTQPIDVVSCAWENNDVFFLRQALLRIANMWEDLYPDAGPCSVKFSEHEIALHSHEEENRGAISEILSLFRDRWGLNPDGMVESDRFDEVQGELARMKDAFVEAADNEGDRILAEKLWPFEDTKEDLS